MYQQRDHSYTVKVKVDGQEKSVPVQAPNQDAAAARAASEACWSLPNQKPPKDVRVVSVTLAI